MSPLSIQLCPIVTFQFATEAFGRPTVVDIRLSVVIDENTRVNIRWHSVNPSDELKIPVWMFARAYADTPTGVPRLIAFGVRKIKIIHLVNRVISTVRCPHETVAADAGLATHIIGVQYLAMVCPRLHVAR